MKRNRGRLAAVCQTYGGQQSDDLMQEVLLQIWRSFSQFEERSGIDTWCYRIALNTAISWRRAAGRRNRILPPSSTEIDKLDGTADGHDDCELLKEFLDTLNDSDRAIVLMYLDDLSGSEMADVLGIGEGALRVRLHRIKKRLAGWHRGDS